MNDLRFAVRYLLKNPGFTAVAVLTLAIGIGATTTIFSIINAVLLRPVAFQESERIVHVWERNVLMGIDLVNTSPDNFKEWLSANRSFESMGYHGEFAGPLSRSFIATGERPERLAGRFVSSGVFQVLRARPLLGRTFLPEEDAPGRDRVVILGHRVWQNRFGGDPNVIGKSITLENFGRHAYQVVGVMPEAFTYPSVAIWLPAGHMHQNFAQRGRNSIHVIGRLKDGISIAQAEADLSSIQARIAETYPNLKRMGNQVGILSFHESMVRGVRESLYIFLAAVGLVLLIACANVANLLLARALGRRKEIALRTALGATRWRIVRQLLIEALVLSLVGGVAGTFLAVWGTQLVIHYSQGSIPRIEEAGLDARVLGFALLVSIGTGILFGLIPAWQASRTDLNEGLKQGGQQISGGTHRNRLFSAFTVAEISLALTLLIGAALLIQSFVRLQQVNPGMDPRGVLTVDVDMAGAFFRNDGDRREFFRQLLEQTRALPGVEAACGVSMIPDRGSGWPTPVWRMDRPVPHPDERLTVTLRPVTPGFLTTFGVQLLKGRELAETDLTGSTKVLMINKALADLLFPGEDPVGRHIECGGVHEIVGLVGNIKNTGLTGETKPEIYGTYQQWWWPSAFLAVRARTDPMALTQVITSRARTLNPDQPLHYFKTMEQYLAEQSTRPRFRTLIIGCFALAALVLASVGIYGVMAYSVAQRTGEMGVRLALGAHPRDVLRLVLGSGMRLTLIGILIGAAGGYALTRFIAAYLFGITPSDPLTFASVSALLAAVALLACVIPARRAAGVDPIVALRHE